MSRPHLDRSAILKETDSIACHCRHVWRSQKPRKACKVIELAREFVLATRASLAEIEAIADLWESGRQAGQGETKGLLGGEE